MSTIAAAGRERLADPGWRATAVIGAVLLGALAVALGAGSAGPRVTALALAAGVLPALALLLGPGAVRALRGVEAHCALKALPLFVAPLLLVTFRLGGGEGGTLPALALLSALGGMVLIGHDLHQRTRHSGVRAQRSPWQHMTRTALVRALPWRMAVGALLVGWSALLALVVLGPYLDGAGVLWAALILVAIVGALVVVGLPVLVGVVAKGDRQNLAQAREDERQRVAAHLHDSVLQTLSLVQRQARDPVAVARLARQQERALRAWMAGQPEARPDTIAGALHTMVEEVEDEESADIEITVLGDRPLDVEGGSLVAAAREALRNAARHASRSTIVVFAEVGATVAEVYVRDEGSGFEVAQVPPERRGVRDAIIGRMAGIGGEARIDSVRGEGTEVALRLPKGATDLAGGSG